MRHLDVMPQGLALLLLLWSHAGLAGQLNIVYTGNLNGELEPCGCTIEGDFGGIQRQTTMLDSLRKADGNLILLSSGGLLSANIPSDIIKSRYILSGMRQLNYDAIGVQESDLLFGIDFLVEQGLNKGLPLVASNHLPGPPFLRAKEIVRQDQRILFFQWLDLALNTDMKLRSQQQSSSAQSALKQALNEARQAGALTVLATTRTLAQAKQSLPLSLIDILIIPSRLETFAKPQSIDNTLLLQPGSRGMRLGQLRLQIDNGSITSWQHKVIDLPQTVEDSPKLNDWYENYNAALREDYQRSTRLKQQAEQGDSPFAGADQCKLCHSDEHALWQQSQHANAYGSLLDVNKVFDPNCINCHSVGFGKTGGFLDNDLTPHLSNVQCESCHGAAKQHSLTGGSEKPANSGWAKERMCGQCHVGNHSPLFDVEKYWPRVSH